MNQCIVQTITRATITMTTITAIIDKAMSTEPYTGKVTMVVLLLNSVVWRTVETLKDRDKDYCSFHLLHMLKLI